MAEYLKPFISFYVNVGYFYGGVCIYFFPAHSAGKVKNAFRL